MALHAKQEPGANLVVRGARVLDPLGPEPRPSVRDIAISGDRITAVEQSVPVPPSAKVVEAKDMLAGSMMPSGLAQSRPEASVLALDIVSTTDSPSVSVSKEPTPKSRMRTRWSGVIMMLDGLSRPCRMPRW